MKKETVEAGDLVCFWFYLIFLAYRLFFMQTAGIAPYADKTTLLLEGVNTFFICKGWGIVYRQR
jgi:hypothetical protein